MFTFKRRANWRLTEKPFDRIPTTWKILIAGLLGSGTGLFILTMWTPGCREQKPPYNGTSKFVPELHSVRRASTKENGFVYCQHSGCSTVTCSAIPESLNPGQVASYFIKEIFQEQCPGTQSIQKLIFDSCTFPDNKLDENWITTNLPIGWLTFRNCALTELPKSFFASSVFGNMKNLEIVGAKIRVLKKWIFDELVNLNSLQIDDNIIHEAEYDLFHSVADSLEVLMLDGCIKDVQVLANITSGSSLSKIQIISLQRNFIPVISSEIFKKTPNVISLYLAKSEIRNFEADTFKETRSLLLLDLKNNLLTNIPKKLFTSVLNNPLFKVWMTENPWNCSCDFEWIQDVITDYPGALKEMPKCESPERNALKYFTNAEFCDKATVTTNQSITATTNTKTTDKTTTEINTVSTESDRSPPLVTFTCKNSEISIIKRISTRKLFTIDQWNYPSRFRDFFVEPLANGNVWINLNSLKFGVSLIWFLSDAVHDDYSSSVNCVSNVKGPLILTNLSRDCSYTICLLEELGKAPSPFNCLAIRTQPVLQTDIWLTNGDKAFVLSIAIGLLIIICVLSIVSSFLVIRRNPSLLKGSKRVVMVRKRSVEALVLPRRSRTNQKKSLDLRGNCLEREEPEPVYLPPVQMRKWTTDCSSPNESRRKDSKASRDSSQYSGASYISGIEPSPIELANWRNSARIRSYSTCLEAEEVEEPPAVPAYRTEHEQIIPSLSLMIDTNEKRSSYSALRTNIHELESTNTRVELVDGIM